MAYQIVFFSRAVREEIFDWPDGISASFTKITERMVEFGPNLGLPYTKSFGKGLFEIRASGPEGIGRAFFCTLAEQHIVILSGFIKKSQATPNSEIKLARKRMKEMQHV